jgi:DNA-binding MarR family transcriptional regulator
MNTKTLNKLLQAGQLLAKASGIPRLEWQTTHTFLVLCLADGEMPQQELEKHLGLAQSSVSRNITRLGVGTPAEPGPRLVESFEDPCWRRRRIVRLTPQGRRLAQQLIEIMEN